MITTLRTTLLFAGACLLLSILPRQSAYGQSLYDYLRRYEIVLGGLYCESDLYDIYNGERVNTHRIHTVTRGAILGIGLHVPIVEPAEALGIGVTADVEVLIGSAPYDPDFPETHTRLDQSEGWLRFAVPVFAALKYGTDATMRPATEMGAGVGIGYRPVFNPRADYSYGSVVAMGEVSFLVSDLLVKLRATAPVTAGSPVDEVDIRTYEFSFLILPGR